METTLDKFGRIVIPKEIRDDFNLKPGSQIRIEESDQAIILKPFEGEPNLHWKDGVFVFSGTPLGELCGALCQLLCGTCFIVSPVVSPLGADRIRPPSTPIIIRPLTHQCTPPPHYHKIQRQ